VSAVKFDLRSHPNDDVLLRRLRKQSPAAPFLLKRENRIPVMQARNSR
jgi:hypothetical protein